MFSALQHQSDERSADAARASERRASAAALASVSGLLALGSDLRTCLEQPGTVSIGEFAAVLERLHGEFRMICGDTELSPDQEDDCASLFVDVPTREFSATDIGQLESILRDL
jgi:hypothetical protein